MKAVAIIQARTDSTRLPGKVMKKIGEFPLIEILFIRLSSSKRLDEIVLATTSSPSDDELAEYMKKKGYKVFRGSEDDVLDRFYEAALQYEADSVVRVTGDCPLVDPEIVDKAIDTFQESSADYVSNTMKPTYPDGLDVSVTSFSAIEEAAKNATESYDREHVVPYIRKRDKFKSLNFTSDGDDLSSLRWTVDEPEDFEVIFNIFDHFSPNIEFGYNDVLELRNERPELFEANNELLRDEGSIMSKGQKLWKRARKVIPGGNSLFSKRPELYLPEKWPVYFSKAKGCKVWDLEGNELIDMICAVGTNTLGYGHESVDAAVLDTISNGNMSSLNPPEEVYLAEKLTSMHQWAEMARFSRSGGEANSMAIRIARAASGRDNVAVCGYHGWHDWYLAANLGSQDSLGTHLLPGLESNGVPKALNGTIHTFQFNDYEALEEIVKSHDIGVIKMEVIRNIEPEGNFLSKVRALSDQHNIVLIFDECTSGFRQTFGGIHLDYDVEPDMAMFGKTLGNGYAITSVLGKEKVMQAAQSSFISSSFWTERIGFKAALKTLEVMEESQSWVKISKTGESIGKLWQELGEKHELEIEVFGIPALNKFKINSPNWMKYKTLISQEMLKKGFLAANIVYVTLAHTDIILEQYGKALDEVFAQIAKCENGSSIDDMLETPICHTEFLRLN